MSDDFRNTPKWQYGRVAVEAVQKKYQEEGWFTVPIDLIVVGDRGGAPKLVGLLKAYRLLDLQYCRAGYKNRWLEVKYKDSPALMQKKEFHADGYSGLRHGIDLPCWRDYLQVLEESGMQGDLALVEVRRGKDESWKPDPILLLQTFEILKKHEKKQIKPERHNNFPKGAVYWPREAFDIVGSIQVDFPEGLQSLAITVHPWERASKKTGIAPGASRVSSAFEELIKLKLKIMSLSPRQWSTTLTEILKNWNNT